MQLRFLLIPFVAFVLLFASCCKKKVDTQPAIPKGFGTLVLFVQDESGKPIVGATVQIVSKSGEAASVFTDAGGRTKGAGQIAQGPFLLRVEAAGYEPQEIQGINLLDGQAVARTVELKKVDKGSQGTPL